MMSSGSAHAQGLSGASSLIVTPTAEMWADGRVAFGADVMPDVCLFRCERPQTVASGVVAIQFLPFVQVGLRVSRIFQDRYGSFQDRVDNFQGVGDRSIVVRFRAWDETRWLPAVLFGARDPFSGSNPHFFSAFAVGTKSFTDVPVFRAMRLHAGYGDSANKALNFPLQGPFGGLSIEPHPWVRMVAEYDTRDVNVGLGLRPIEHLDVSVRMYGFAELGGGVSYSIGL
ncbi:MAG: YjbH domain-containing protein [Rhodothermales bacterium]